MDPNSPETDAQFLAFSRAAGYDDAEVVASGGYKKSSLQAALLSRAPQYADQMAKEQQEIGNSFEDKGLSSSGFRVSAQNTAKNTLQHRITADQNDVAQQSQGIDLEIARQLAASQRRRQEEQLNATVRTTLGNAQGSLNQYL